MIHLVNLLLHSELGVFAFRILEEEEYSDYGDAADREIDLETSAPRCFCSLLADGTCGLWEDLLSVRAPPKMGPITEEMPNMLESRPM